MALSSVEVSDLNNDDLVNLLNVLNEEKNKRKLTVLDNHAEITALISRAVAILSKTYQYTINVKLVPDYDLDDVTIDSMIIDEKTEEYEFHFENIVGEIADAKKTLDLTLRLLKDKLSRKHAYLFENPKCPHTQIILEKLYGI